MSVSAAGPAAALDSLPLTTTSVHRYDEQLGAKVAAVRERFRGTQLPEIEVFESVREHYRMRAEFRVWREGDDLYYVMFDKPDAVRACCAYKDDNKMHTPAIYSAQAA